MNKDEIRVLKKIQNQVYDDEVKESINKDLQWYIDHAEDLLD